ncbi:ATP-dependent DNA helicase DinG [Pseudorhodoferax soli]|uniref:ATP-dependent DNA helicase DinG n=1 Tax=Pseudorhodoferax soli TaxID=545864 RepID=A0A368XAY8_9BURK|nr:ATP-dependent DNA helicase DinG [Pseudorhodoferax soli]RCW65133.1 ATP-dependent DNA helicase DinG [Pseudorhodoferax soli]
MLTQPEMELMRSCLDAVRAGSPGFRKRRAQLQMIAAVAHVLGRAGCNEGLRQAGAHLGVIEAGTGTGKTVGYLLPALVIAHLRGRKLVVSSSTVTLQEQLLHKDLPALLALLPFSVQYGVAKGRRRFLCPARLARRLNGEQAEDVLLDPEEAAIDPDAGKAAIDMQALLWHRKLADRFEAGRWDGDRDAWPELIPDKVWRGVSTDRQGCMGARCPSFGQCPFYLGRQRAQDADVVVANHDLVLSAAAIEGGTTLPDLREALLVFDEAHSLPAKMVSRGATRHSLCGAGSWLGSAVNAAQAACRALRASRRAPVVPEPALAGARLGTALDRLMEVVGRHCEFTGEQSVHRFRAGLLPGDVQDCGAGVLQAAQAMGKELDAIRSALVQFAGEAPAQAQPHLSALAPCLARTEQLVSTWTAMLRTGKTPACGGAQEEAPTARWIERCSRPDGEDDFQVCASPLSGGPRLRELLWERVGAAVLTSATVRACGRFDLFLEEAGLRGLSALKLLHVSSPFDYASKATLHIPAVQADPRDPTSHGQEVSSRLPALLEQQRGTLVLFASGRQMREVHAALPKHLRDLVLMQGVVARRELIARHRERIDAGQCSVLFGLASLAEGVDLPRDYCTHVICAKLPFSVPDGPVEQARREWIEAQGRSAFLERSVPEVGIRLAQATGRLLRTDDDYGTVTVLDPRLGSTRWGRMLLRGLPPFRIVIGDRPLHAQSQRDSQALEVSVPPAPSARSIDGAEQRGVLA